MHNNKRETQKNKNNLILCNREFIFLRYLLRPFYIASANIGFFKWITSKYGILRQQKTRFPTLFFFLGRIAPVLQRALLKYTPTLPLNKDYFPSQNFFFNLNLVSQISLLKANNQVITEKIPGRALPPEVLNISDSSFIFPDIHLLKYKLISELITQPIFPETSNVLTTKVIESLLQHQTKIVPAFLKVPHFHKAMTYLSSKNKPGQVMNFSSDMDFNPERSEFNQDSQYIMKALEQPTEGNAVHPTTKDSISALHYINPLKISLDELKKSALAADKKAIGREKFTEQSRRDNFSGDYKVPHNTSKMNIDLNRLTDEVYHMLERKMRIEKERRGL